MLHGTKIEGTLIGGPSFGLIFKGDQIVRIDGKDVTSETVLGALRGCDIPGSKVTITIQRQNPVSEMPGLAIQNNRLKMHAGDENVDVEVTRMATADIADHQRIFELFTVFKVHFCSGSCELRMFDTIMHFKIAYHVSKEMVSHVNLTSICANYNQKS
jgi:hypothetical protein